MLFGVYPAEVEIIVSNSTIVSTTYVHGIYNPGMYANISQRCKNNYSMSLIICERHTELVGHSLEWPDGRYRLKAETVHQMLKNKTLLVTFTQK